MSLSDYLAGCDARYEPEIGLVGATAHTPGYHTRLPDGAWVHDTRGNFDYAQACLQAGDAQHRERAARVLEVLLGHQESDPCARTYGIWPWFSDEPLDQMAPPDWNWADFCGARLAAILRWHQDRLPPELAGRCRQALGHAAWSIFRRNVQPDYTNIAIMGAGVTLAAGELLAEPRLVDYGRRRLRRLVEHTRWHGDFNEYNSPTYTLVAIEEADRILELVRDRPARADAEGLRRRGWRVVAEHWHPGCGEWAGPHSRCYGDHLPDETRAWLRDGGLPAFSLTRRRPCPADLRPRFESLGRDELMLRRRFVRRAAPAAGTVGSTWLNAEACLGTVNHDTLWVQRRPLLAYWRLDGVPAAVLRLRMLKDGRDFASGAVWTAQRGPRALSLIGCVPGQGDFHPGLDRPADGVFEGRRLVVRYELAAAEAQVVGTVLRAGAWQAVVQPLAGVFEGCEVRWTAGCGEDRAWVEAVFYDGPRRGFDREQLASLSLAAGLTVGEAGMAAESPVAWRDATRRAARWPAAGLTVGR